MKWKKRSQAILIFLILCSSMILSLEYHHYWNCLVSDRKIDSIHRIIPLQYFYYTAAHKEWYSHNLTAQRVLFPDLYCQTDEEDVLTPYIQDAVELENAFKSVLTQYCYNDDFNEYIDYSVYDLQFEQYHSDQDELYGYTKDTSQNGSMKEKYEFYCKFHYDEKGNLIVDDAYGLSGDEVKKELEEMSLYELCLQNWGLGDDELFSNIYQEAVQPILNTQFVMAIQNEIRDSVYENSLYKNDAAGEFLEGGYYVWLISLGVIIATVACLLYGKKNSGISDILAFRLPFELNLAITVFLVYAFPNIVEETFTILQWKNSGDVLPMLNLQYAEGTELAIQATVYFSFYLVGTVNLLNYVQIAKMGIAKYCWEKILCVRIVRFVILGLSKRIGGWIGKICKKEKEKFRTIQLSDDLTRTVLLILVLNACLVMICTFFNKYMNVVACTIYLIVTGSIVMRVYQKIKREYDELNNQVHEMATGNLTYEGQVKGRFFGTVSTQLRQIQDGFKSAIEEEVKSEKMKTELVTNVSHDLKTPLTAIITYVDLLKKPDLGEEERQEYIWTLEQKSGRLKNLIEDLFEISKANSKSVNIVLVEVDLLDLIKQVTVEYKEKLEEAKIELRYQVPADKVVLQLDSQKTFRIFENLFINLYKYAMPSTRAYITIATTDEQVHVELKNISAEEMNFDEQQIMERFVRGDLSRNTEGSGLGLAIVNSFVELQGGKFEIHTDGDLFKAVITFNR